MKILYATFVVSALLSQVASAQLNHALTTNPVREAMRLEKLNSHHGHYTPTGQRGGGGNDDCSGAVVLTVGATCTPTNGDLSGATQSMDPATCSTFTDSLANDLWYTFTATSAATSVEATGGPDIDPVVEVFSGNCGNLVSQGCSDATLVNETEVWTIATTVGSVYYARVYYWAYPDAPTDYSFTVCAYQGIPAPPNDLCGGVTAQALNVGGSLTYSGTTVGSTDTEGFGFSSTFESFTLTECANVTIDYCGMNPVFPGWTTGLGTNCPLTNVMAPSDTGSCADGNKTVTYDQVPAGTYWFAQAALAGVIEAGPYTANVSATSCIIGIDEVTTSDWSLFPNPGAGTFNLQYTGKTGLVNIDVMDVTGRVVYSERTQLAKGTVHSLDLAGLSIGNYNVRLTVDGVRSEQRLMVK